MNVGCFWIHVLKRDASNDELSRSVAPKSISTYSSYWAAIHLNIFLRGEHPSKSTIVTNFTKVTTYLLLVIDVKSCKNSVLTDGGWVDGWLLVPFVIIIYILFCTRALLIEMSVTRLFFDENVWKPSKHLKLLYTSTFLFIEYLNKLLFLRLFLIYLTLHSFLLTFFFCCLKMLDFSIINYAHIER